MPYNNELVGIFLPDVVTSLGLQVLSRKLSRIHTTILEGWQQ
jgi:hypothetical protein